jgi:hypothetical protein
MWGLPFPGMRPRRDPGEKPIGSGKGVARMRADDGWRIFYPRSFDRQLGVTVTSLMLSKLELFPEIQWKPTLRFPELEICWVIV